jgi:hypothetical protein
MILSPEERELLPSDDDVAFYRRHGWYVSKKILPDAVIDEAIRGSERYFAGERDAALPITGGYSDWRPGHGEGIRNCEYVALQNREIRRLVEYPLLGAVAARLSGSPVIRLFDDQLIFKPPDASDAASVVGWHTDRAYWLTCTSENMLTAWVPFHDCPEIMGPVAVVDGSHQWSGTNELRTFKENNLEHLETRFKETGAPFVKIPMALQKGQVSFHHCRAIHGSDVNRGSFPRLSLAIHMQDGANRFRVYRNEHGIPWRLVNDQLCRQSSDGTPDYTDPEVFPVLWSEDN